MRPSCTAPEENSLPIVGKATPIAENMKGVRNCTAAMTQSIAVNGA